MSPLLHRADLESGAVGNRREMWQLLSLQREFRVREAGAALATFLMIIIVESSYVYVLFIKIIYYYIGGFLRLLPFYQPAHAKPPLQFYRKSYYIHIQSTQSHRP